MTEFTSIQINRLIICLILLHTVVALIYGSAAYTQKADTSPHECQIAIIFTAVLQMIAGFSVAIVFEYKFNMPDYIECY
jgi:hypothetical protein